MTQLNPPPPEVPSSFFFFLYDAERELKTPAVVNMQMSSLNRTQALFFLCFFFVVAQFVCLVLLTDLVIVSFSRLRISSYGEVRWGWVGVEEKKIPVSPNPSARHPLPLLHHHERKERRKEGKKNKKTTHNAAMASEDPTRASR